ncbi:hypothetical protein [Halorubrum pallidum]|uniref:DUF4861 domain-containing protein n=1 Tax=Halorubrum pallidum TaxID=1526114 RepID=A0ABD5T6K7_9EURY
MDRRALLSILGVGVASLAGCTDGTGGSQTSDQSDLPQRYPDGAGPESIDFSTLTSDDTAVLHAPREHWDSYAIAYSEPPDRRRIEGSYYIDASTGEVISDLWDGARDYRNGDTYAYVQPADRIRDQQQRDQWDADPQFTYHNATDAYYRYDRQYGQIAPTNVGRHTDLIDAYGWEAIAATTHHGVPVITYRLSDTEPDSDRGTPAVSGSLELGVDDGIVYGFDITLDAEGEPRYTYTVRPEPFPDHEWVETARRVASANRSANGSTRLSGQPRRR